MSQQNIEIVKRGWEQWKATGEVRAQPGFVWDVTNLGWPGQQVYDGAEGATQFLAEWADAWDEWELDLEEYIDAGDRVVGIINQRACSKGTGIPVEMRFAQVWEFEDGRVTRMLMYANPDDALAAVGLRD